MPSYTTGSLDYIYVAMKDQVADHLKTVTTTLHNELMAGTPVHSGEAVAAWIASDTPTSARPKHSTAGDPGPTSGMALGSEPRRAANEAIARQSLATVDFATADVVYIQNHAPHIIALEYGELPSEEKNRTPPLGIVATAIQRTLSKT